MKVVCILLFGILLNFSNGIEKRNKCLCTSGPNEIGQMEFSLTQDCNTEFVATITNPYPYCACECCAITDFDNGKIDCQYPLSDELNTS